MQIMCTSLETDNHASTSPLFLQAGWPSWRPINGGKARRSFFKLVCMTLFCLMLATASRRSQSLTLKALYRRSTLRLKAAHNRTLSFMFHRSCICDVQQRQYKLVLLDHWQNSVAYCCYSQFIQLVYIG